MTENEQKQHLSIAHVHAVAPCGKAAYTKTKGIDPIRYAEMVRAYVEDHGAISPAECRELLGLGESQTAKVEVSRLFKKWCGPAGFLRREGKPPKVRYYSSDQSEQQRVLGRCRMGRAQTTS
jgi:hypothetical protein